jgi:hypothetical protein
LLKQARMKVAVLVFLAACAVEVDTSETEQAATTAFANDQAAFDFFLQKGLSDFQAAGIVGNLDQESGVDPTIAQYGGGPGPGLAQWSVGGRWDTTHNDNVLAYATQKSENAKSLNLQLEFIWYEMTQIGYGYSALQATTNVTDATIAFMAKYEICGTCASSQRVAYAKDVLAAYGGTPAFAAKPVSESWPATIPLTCGGTVDLTLTLANKGAIKWTTATKLGTTMPRDRKSMFAGSEWAAPDRPAAITGTVAPGANGTFTFTLHAPTGAACVAGTYHEHFGVVQENVAWFSDDSQGGPADDQIEAVIDLQPGDGNPVGSDSSGDASGGCSTGGTPGMLLWLASALGLHLPRSWKRRRAIKNLARLAGR